jgi:hypothetical protein
MRYVRRRTRLRFLGPADGTRVDQLSTVKQRHASLLVRTRLVIDVHLLITCTRTIRLLGEGRLLERVHLGLCWNEMRSESCC